MPTMPVEDRPRQIAMLRVDQAQVTYPFTVEVSHRSWKRVAGFGAHSELLEDDDAEAVLWYRVRFVQPPDAPCPCESTHARVPAAVTRAAQYDNPGKWFWTPADSLRLLS
jgi:hypothetical protein